MTRSEMIHNIRRTLPYLTPAQAETAVDMIFESITTTLAEGGRVELRGFGSFTVRKRKPRLGRNPRLGTAVKVKEKSVPFFKIGKALKERLNA